MKIDVSLLWNEDRELLDKFKNRNVIVKHSNGELEQVIITDFYCAVSNKDNKSIAVFITERGDNLSDDDEIVGFGN